MKKLVVPKFPIEAEEAEWWDNHMEVVEENLVEGMQEGTVGRGTAQRVLREARELKSITIRMPEADVNRAQRLSAKKGLSSEAYPQDLLHEALEREEGEPASGDENRPSSGVR
jgi:predicted DNA binding CopG/RHH family protein